VDRCTVTGNLIWNDGVDSAAAGPGGPNASLPLIVPSLILSPRIGTGQGVPHVVVTGNVFGGDTVLPARPATTPPTPPPMNTWDFLNTKVTAAVH
jgi:hypothetical protein